MLNYKLMSCSTARWDLCLLPQSRAEYLQKYTYLQKYAYSEDNNLQKENDYGCSINEKKH